MVSIFVTAVLRSRNGRSEDRHGVAKLDDVISGPMAHPEMPSPHPAMGLTRRSSMRKKRVTGEAGSLVLRRETLRRLETADLERVAGEGRIRIPIGWADDTTPIYSWVDDTNP